MLGFIIFLSIMISALGLLCLIVYKDAVVHWVPVLTKRRFLLAFGIILLPLIFIVSVFGVRSDADEFFNIFYIVGGQTLQWLFVLTTVAIVYRIGSIFIKKPWLYKVVFALGCIGYLYSVWAGLYMQEKQIEIVSADVTRVHKLAFIADMHLGPMWDADDFQEVLDRVTEAKPEALLIAGDLFDGTDVKFDEISDVLRNATEKYPVYFVTGNHEYYGATGAFIQTLKNAGVYVIDDTRILLGGATGEVELVGIGYGGDAASRQQKAFDQARAEALGTSTAERFTIALKHVPDYTDVVLTYISPDLMLFGHSHGGQQFPFSLIARLQYGQYAAGLTTTSTGLSYTTSGVGSWGPFNRLFTDREIVFITLIPKSE